MVRDGSDFLSGAGFAVQLGLGPWPALFSLGMMLAYSVVMGVVYSVIDAGSVRILVTDRLAGGPRPRPLTNGHCAAVVVVLATRGSISLVRN